MDKETRLILLALLIAVAAWRCAQYMRAGDSRSKRRMSQITEFAGGSAVFVPLRESTPCDDARATVLSISS
jgi:hypothetical protein